MNQASRGGKRNNNNSFNNGARRQSWRTHNKSADKLQGAIGKQVVISTRQNEKLRGTLISANHEITLKQDTKHTKVQLKDLVDLEQIKADSFKVDTDISKAKHTNERELKPWTPDVLPDDPAIISSSQDASASLSWADDYPSNESVETQDNHQGGAWDQFKANEQMFGLQTNYNEEMYTTKLDRSGNDYKEREKKADKLAKEILNQQSSNAHVNEERGQSVALTEEEKYSGVTRGPNAYVPPQARRASQKVQQQQSLQQPEEQPLQQPVQQPVQQPEQPLQQKEQQPSQPEQQQQPQPPTAPKSQVQMQLPHEKVPTKPSDPSLIGDFRAFVSNEKERLQQKKQALVNQEKSSTVADLIKFGQSFKLKTDMPEDIAGIVAKNERKEKEKESDKSISDTSTKSNAKPDDFKQSKSPSLKQYMNIPKIPPFNPERVKAVRAERNRHVSQPATNQSPGSPPVDRRSVVSPALSQASTSTAGGSKSLNPKAFSFKPNPNAMSFTPGGSSNNLSPKPPSQSTSQVTSTSAPTPIKNPFFGTKPIKRGLSGLHVKEDFNPFKNQTVMEAQQIGPHWQFSGKSYKSRFPSNQYYGNNDYGSPDEAVAAQNMVIAQAQAAAQAQAQAAMSQGQPYYYRIPFGGQSPMPNGGGPMGAPGAPGAPPGPGPGPYGMVPQFIAGPPSGQAIGFGPQMQPGQGPPPAQMFQAAMAAGLQAPRQAYMPQFSPNMQNRPPMGGPPPGHPQHQSTTPTPQQSQQSQPSQGGGTVFAAYPSPSPQMTPLVPYPAPQMTHIRAVGVGSPGPPSTNSPSTYSPAPEV